MARNRAAAPLALLIALAACSDSQRRASVAVEPPPPAPPAADTTPPAPPPVPPLRVSPKQVAFNALGDTMRIVIPDGAECRSASDAVAVIEHGSLLKSVANGTTHVRCWLDGRTGSVKVTVAQQLARVSIVAERGFNIRRNGDSLRFVFQPLDRLGRPVPTAEPSWQSLAPEVVRVDNAGLAVGLADSGRARIVAAAGGMSDTITVEIGIKTAVTELLSASARNASRARLLARARGNRGTQVAGPGGVLNQSFTPGANNQQQQQNPSGINARPITTQDSLFQDPQLGLTGGRRFIVPFAIARMSEHRLARLNDSLIRTSGLLIGGGADILTRGLLSFRFQFMAGQLGAEDSLAADRTVLDASFDVGFALSPWLNIVGGVSSRRFEDAAIERFLAVRAGGEANFSLGGGPLRGIARVLVLPLVSIASSQSAAESPSFGIISALGLGFENRRLSSSLVYEIERYSFPANVGRKEQFGSLLFRFGYKVGW